MHTGRSSAFPWLSGLVQQLFFIRVPSWDVASRVGLPLPRIAAQTGVVLQRLRSFSARVKKAYTGEAQQSLWCAREGDRRDEALDLCVLAREADSENNRGPR